MERQAQEMGAGWTARTLVRRWPLIAICFAVGFGAALGLSLVQTKIYSAEASLLFRDPGFDQQLYSSGFVPSGDPEREAATNLALVTLDTVADITADKLDSDITGDDVSDQVTVDSGGQSDVVTVTAHDEDPSEAALIANTFAKAYVDFRRDADRMRVRDARLLVERNLEQLPEDQRSGPAGRSLQQQISKLEAFEALQTGNAEVVQEAAVPSDPSSPRTARNAVLGGLLGLLLGLTLALLLARLDRRLRDPKEFEDAFGLPLLATIPDRKALSRGGDRMEQLLESDAEVLRMLRARLRYFNVDHTISSVLVTSTAAGDGKTTLSWNFAVSAARAGSKTLFVEADLRKPTVAERETLAPIPGLAELLSEQAELDHAIQTVAALDSPSATPEDAGRGGSGPVKAGGVDVIVAGAPPPNAGELLESERMAQLLDDLKKKYDLIVIDTPPVSLVSDAIPLLRLVDGAILVARSGHTTRDAAEEVSGQLRTLEAPALGVVVNRASARRHSYYGYESSQAAAWS